MCLERCQVQDWYPNETSGGGPRLFNWLMLFFRMRFLPLLAFNFLKCSKEVKGTVDIIDKKL